MNIIKSGMVLILIGFVAIIAGMLLSARKVEFGGLIMIGPIPIAFGTSSEITVIAMVIGLIMMLVFYALVRRNV
jgi:uncharacterized protein (TIGR00304 family)